MNYGLDDSMDNTMNNPANQSPTGANSVSIGNTNIMPAAINNQADFIKTAGVKPSGAPMPFKPNQQKTIKSVFGAQMPGTFDMSMNQDLTL